MDSKRNVHASNPSTDSNAKLTETPAVEFDDMMFEAVGSDQSSDSSVNTSIAMAACNLSLLAMVFAAMGLGGFEFLFGYGPAPEDENLLGGVFYVIGRLLLFIVRFAFFPAFTVLAIVGGVLAIGSTSFRRDQPLASNGLVIGLLIFHGCCLVPPLVFVVRTILFLGWA